MRHKPLLHFLLFRKASETKSLYFLITLKTFALSLISIFIPIFLYELGYPLREIALFFLIYSLCAFFFVFAAGYLFNKIGVKFGMLIGTFFIVAAYLCLAFVLTNHFLFYLSPILMGGYLGIFWVNFHTDMADNLKRKNLAEGIGLLNVFSSFVAAAAPIIGAFIASVNFPVLFIISSCLIFISTIPLFLSKGVKEKNNFDIKETLSLINSRRFFAGLGVGGETVVAYFFWPIFLFLILGIENVGWVTSLSLIVSAIFILFMAKVIEKKGANKVLKTGVIINTIHWPFRLLSFLAAPFHVIYSFLETISKMPFTVKTYKVGKKGREINAIAAREMTLHLGRTVGCILFFFFPSFVFIFIAATIFSFIQIFFAFEKEGKKI